MANTYTQIHIQAVFAVRNRLCLISDKWKDELYKYIGGIIKHNLHQPLSINGMPDHIHILFGFRPAQSLSALMQDIKGSSSRWINDRKFFKGKFAWQEGYGAFSYSKSEIQKVAEYIENQEIHHKGLSFSKEYKELLEEFGVEYDNKYVFSPVDTDYFVPDGTRDKQ